MSFPFNAYLAAGLLAMLTSWASLPAWRRFAHRFDLVDDPGHRKIHATRIPLAGGLAVLSGLLVPILLGFVTQLLPSLGVFHETAWDYGVARRAAQLLAVMVGAIAMAGLGLLDDRYELPPSAKFAGQFTVALLVAAAGVRITLFVPSLVFSYTVTVLWILTITNAMNFLDNMNGLCAGVGALAAWFFALNAAIQGQYLVTVLALSGCGALLGFLPHNYPKAGAFLGDAGSHLVGYLLAILAILPHFYSASHPQTLAVLRPLLILGIPLLDLSWVVAFRSFQGKPFYVGDTNHLSHWLVRLGMSKTTAVAIIWLGATVCGAAAFLL